MDVMMEEWRIWWHQWLFSAGLYSWQALFLTTLMLLEDSQRENSAKANPSLAPKWQEGLPQFAMKWGDPAAGIWAPSGGFTGSSGADLSPTQSAMLTAGGACTALQVAGTGRAGWDGCRGCSAHALRGGIFSKFEALRHRWPCIRTVKSFQVTSLSPAKPY